MKQIFAATIGGILGGVTVKYGPHLVWALVNKHSSSKSAEGVGVDEEV